MVNPAKSSPGPFLPAQNWRILAQDTRLDRCWPRTLKCVNEPNGFLDPGTYAPAHSGRTYGRFAGCGQWGSRVVVVPASREPGKEHRPDRGLTQGPELHIAESNRREGRR